MTDTNEPKHAVVLSGGGADGAYEIGILKALFSGRAASCWHGLIEPDIFTGTSIGAFNASLLVSRWDQHGSAAITDLERVWREVFVETAASTNGGYRFRLNPLNLLNPYYYVPNPIQPFLQMAQDSLALGWDGIQRFVGFLQSTAPLADRFLSLFDLTSIVSRDPLEQTVRETIQLENIRSSRKKLIVAATNWDSGELKLYHNTDMTDYIGTRAILASAAIPGFFPPTEVGA